MGLNMEKTLKATGAGRLDTNSKTMDFWMENTSNITLLHIKFKFKANVAAHRKQVQSLYGAKHGQTI